jgi:hypothetical protein
MLTAWSMKIYGKFFLKVPDPYFSHSFLSPNFSIDIFWNINPCIHQEINIWGIFK